MRTSAQVCASDPYLVRYQPLSFSASQCEDSSFEDLTEESRTLGWANMGNLKLVRSHKIHKE